MYRGEEQVRPDAGWHTNQDIHGRIDRDVHEHPDRNFHGHQGRDNYGYQDREFDGQPGRNHHGQPDRSYHGHIDRDFHGHPKTYISGKPDSDFHGHQDRDFHGHQNRDFHGQQERDVHWHQDRDFHGHQNGRHHSYGDTFDNLDRAEDRRFTSHGRPRQNGSRLNEYTNDGYEEDRYTESSMLQDGFDGRFHAPRDHVDSHEMGYMGSHQEPLTPKDGNLPRTEIRPVGVNHETHGYRQGTSYGMQGMPPIGMDGVASTRNRSFEEDTIDFGVEMGHHSDTSRNRQGGEQFEMQEVPRERTHQSNYGDQSYPKHDYDDLEEQDQAFGHDRTSKAFGEQFELKVMKRNSPQLTHADVHDSPDYDQESHNYSQVENNNTGMTSEFDQNVLYNNTRRELYPNNPPERTSKSANYNMENIQNDLSDTESLYRGNRTRGRRSKLARQRTHLHDVEDNQRKSFADGMKTLIRRRQTIRLKSEQVRQSMFKDDMAPSTSNGTPVDDGRSSEGSKREHYEHMAEEYLPSTQLQKTKSLKHRLAVIHREGTVSTAQNATLLRDHILTKEQSRLKGLDLRKYQISMGWQRFKNWVKSQVYQLELWSGAFKVIEGRFGTATMSYFRFLRWLMFLNMFMTIFMLSIVFLPFMLIQPNTGFSTSVNECDSEFHYRAVFLSQNYSALTADTSTTESSSQLVLDFLQGTGMLENTELFYGRYHNKTSTLPSGSKFEYHMGLAYLFAIGVSFLLSFALLVKNSAKVFKQSVLMSSSGTVTLYCNKVFGAWDYCIAQGKTAELKHQSIMQDFKNELEYQRLQWKKESRTKREKAKLYSIRILVNLFVLAVLGSSLYLIYFTNTSLIELSTQERNEALQLILQYLPSIVITLLGVIVPIVFNKVVVAEDYMPAFRIRITLTRVVLLRLASLGILMISLYTGLTKGRKHEAIDIPCNVTVTVSNNTLDKSTDANNTSSSPGGIEDIPCWENYVGQQIYKLVMLNFLVVIAVTFLWEFPRKLMFKRFHSKVKVIDLLGQQEFDLTKNVLDLIYLQTLCWLGMFFSPLIPAMCFVKCFLFFYIKKTSLLRNCLPMQEYGTSKSNSLFMMVLLLSFGLAAIPIAAMVGIIQPSEACGPFRVYSNEGYVMFGVITNLVSSWTKVKAFFHFIGTGGFMTCVGLLLCCLMYYFYIAGQANYNMSKNLKEQLKVEGRDKQFLLARVNEALELEDVEEEPDGNQKAARAVASAAAAAM